jgi:hypothetical protein
MQQQDALHPGESIPPFWVPHARRYHTRHALRRLVVAVAVDGGAREEARRGAGVFLVLYFDQQ